MKELGWLLVILALVVAGGIILFRQKAREGKKGQEKREKTGEAVEGPAGPVQKFLYLVQHGEAVDEKVDANRPLSEKGKQEVVETANFLKGAAVKVDEVWHSSKLRARQTAEIICEALGLKESLEKRFLNPSDPASPVAGVIDSSPKNILIAGHLPFLSKLASLLLSGSEDKEMVKFMQGRVLSLVKKAEGWAVEKERSNLF